MADVGAIAAAFASLKAAGEITKAMIGLRDATLLQNKVIELNGVIISAQQSAFTAQTAQTELLNSVGRLEKRVADLEAWEAEKQNYQLAEVGPGVFAYALKPEMQNAEPSHLLCANCYQQGNKSLLQATQELRLRHRVHVCPRCKSDFTFSYVPAPPPPRVNRYNPLRRG